MFIKTKIKIIALLCLISLLSSPFSYADSNPIKVYAKDTVAGYATLLKSSLMDPNKDITFVVKKPDSSLINIPAKSDLEGFASMDLYGHQTKIAGKYTVSAKDNYSSQFVDSSFNVYPDKLSLSQSFVRSTEQMLEADKDSGFLIVTLMDQYRNPIANHHVSIISSRSEDEILALQNGVSDINGRANFKISSKYPGTSVITAIDNTENVTLEDREDIMFFQATVPEKKETNSFIGSLKADIGGEDIVLPGPVDHFDIENLSKTVKVNEELSMKVIAKDKDDNIAKNYTGTILISIPDDENANLPNNGEYTFKASDQGEFTFNLSLSFATLGKQVVQILDKNNFRIAGEYDLEVIPEGALIAPSNTSSLVIKAPSDNSEFASNFIILSGKGDENINLNLFDNDIKIAESETDNDGFFQFEIRALDNGEHNFYVMNPEASEISKSIKITIDTISPTLDSIKTSFDGPVLSDSYVEISLYSEPNLDSVTYTMQGVEKKMDEVEAGLYRAGFNAPSQASKNNISFTLTDKLGNKSDFPNKVVLEVQELEDKSPPAVSALDAKAGDSSIQLTWNAITNHENTIDKYRIYYGLDENNLNNVVDTLGNSPKWELKGLENGLQYFIAVKAVDSKGMESSKFSTILAVSPKLPDLCENVQCLNDGLCQEGSCLCKSGFDGEFCETEIKKEEDDPILSVDTELTGTVGDSSAILSWPSFPGVRAYYYKVLIGLSPNNYSDYYITKDNSRNAEIKDLMNGVSYYFSVMALDINGDVISQKSKEIKITPSSSNMHSAPSENSGYVIENPVNNDNNNSNFDSNINRENLNKVPETNKTGPESVWVIMLSLLFAQFFYHHKKKILSK